MVVNVESVDKYCHIHMNQIIFYSSNNNALGLLCIGIGQKSKTEENETNNLQFVVLYMSASSLCL